MSRPFRRRNVSPERDDVQIPLVGELRAAGVFVHHSNNSTGRAGQRAQALVMRAGVYAGMPDLLIFDPPPNMPGRIGAALELKAEGGGKPSDAQFACMARLETLGWATAWAKGYELARARLVTWGYLRDDVTDTINWVRGRIEATRCR